MRKIDKLIVHCSATRKGQHINVDTIRRWHKANGWSDIGYHYVIYLDGSIHVGRPVELAGAHTKGENKNSIGICYVGGVLQDGKTASDTRTQKQKESLELLLTRLKHKHCDALVYGHRDFAPKDCPSFDAKNEYNHISEL